MVGDVFFHLLHRCLACAGRECGVVVAILCIDALHHVLQRPAVRGIVVVELLHSPFQAFLLGHAIAIHQVEAARDIVVVPPVDIFRPVGLHHFHHPVLYALHLGRPPNPLLCLGLSLMAHYLDALWAGTEHGLGVMSQSAHPRVVATLRVVVERC